MTTSQVSDATRVRRTIIEAIEHDDLAPAGGTSTPAATSARSAACSGWTRPRCSLASTRRPSRRSRRTSRRSPRLRSRLPAARSAPSAGCSRARDQARADGPELVRRRWPVRSCSWSASVRCRSYGRPPTPRARRRPSPARRRPRPRPPPGGPAPARHRPWPRQPSQTPDGGNAIAQADGVNVALSITGRASWVSASTSKGTAVRGHPDQGRHQGLQGPQEDQVHLRQRRVGEPAGQRRRHRRARRGRPRRAHLVRTRRPDPGAGLTAPPGPPRPAASCRRANRGGRAPRILPW